MTDLARRAAALTQELESVVAGLSADVTRLEADKAYYMRRSDRLGAAEVRVKELEQTAEAHSAENAEMRGVGLGYTLATGSLFCDISDFHGFAEKLIARPILTHEFGSHAVWVELRERFESLVREVGSRGGTPLPVSSVVPVGETETGEAESAESADVRVRGER